MLRSFFLISTITAIAACSPSQSITLSGEVTSDDGAFGLLDTRVTLQSGALDLSNHVGERLDLTGRLLSGSQPPTVIIDSAIPSPSRLRVIGDNRIGRSFSLRLDDETALTYYILVSFGECFLPLDGMFPGVHGTFFLNLSTLFTVSSGPLASSWLMDLTIPNDPGLAGLPLLFQGRVTYDNLGELYYGNVARLTVEI